MVLLQGIVIVFDLTRESSFEHVDSWVKSVRLVSDLCASMVVSGHVCYSVRAWVGDGGS